MKTFAFTEVCDSAISQSVKYFMQASDELISKYVIDDRDMSFSPTQLEMLFELEQTSDTELPDDDEVNRTWIECMANTIRNLVDDKLVSASHSMDMLYYAYQIVLDIFTSCDQYLSRPDITDETQRALSLYKQTITARYIYYRELEIKLRQWYDDLQLRRVAVTKIAIM
jgi:hypothetical protein